MPQSDPVSAVHSKFALHVNRLQLASWVDCFSRAQVGLFWRALQQALRSSKSLVPFVPRAPAKGPVDRTWGVIVNE